MRILIADDHAIVREGLKQIIKNLPSVSSIDEAQEGQEAFAMIKNNAYDMAVLDISMPGLSGLDILQKVRNAGIPIRVLMLSVHPEEQYAIRAFKLGASGYLSKGDAYTELSLAISKIAAGGKYVSSTLAEKMLFYHPEKASQNRHESLSEREFQVMILLAGGKSVMEIAAILFLSDKTISTYRSRILEKMNMKKNAELTLYAIKNHLIE